MNRQRLLENVNADTLIELGERLSVRGYESPLLHLRLRYNELTQIRDQYLERMRGVERVHPGLLPTQASGRWSVTRPPLVNFPDWIRNTVWPDEREVWIAWDLDAIEAKIVAARSHDHIDLQAFAAKHDIHTITACNMMGLPLPPNLSDPHQSPECADWRAKLGWRGKEDSRRLIAKVRYALLYGRDHTAIHDSKYERDFVKMGFSRAVIVDAAKKFLASKPNLVSTRRQAWTKVAAAREARTIYGRRRRLFGDWWARAKEGWNHEIQGSVTDMVNVSLIELLEDCPEWHLVYPSHDAAKIAIPEEHLTNDPDGTLSIFKDAVEKTHIIEGETIKSTATWHIYKSDGTVVHL